MNKKLISSILVVALLNLLGCYSSELVNATEYKQIEEEGKPNEIYVITKDSQEYHFSESNFYVENDTLYGKGKLLLSDGEELFDGKIAFSEIESIKFEYLNGATTALLVLGIVAILAIIGFFIGIGVGLGNLR